MHRGKDDVIRRFLAKLDDEFAEVGFHDFEARMLQRVVEMNLLRRHRLGLDDASAPFSRE